MNWLLQKMVYRLKNQSLYMFWYQINLNWQLIQAHLSRRYLISLKAINFSFYIAWMFLHLFIDQYYWAFLFRLHHIKPYKFAVYGVVDMLVYSFTYSCFFFFLWISLKLLTEMHTWKFFSSSFTINVESKTGMGFILI